MKAIDAAIDALKRPVQHLAPPWSQPLDPPRLERIEERLFALRAAARDRRAVEGLAALANMPTTSP